METNKSFLLIGIGIVSGLVIGGMFGYAQGKKYADEKIRIIEERVKEFFPAIEDIRAISGSVRERKGDALIIETSLPPNPFEEWPRERTVVITDKTKIVKQISKNPAMMQKEIEEGISPLNLFFEETVLFEDIMIGSYVSVEATENIKTKIRFEAVNIIVSQ